MNNSEEGTLVEMLKLRDQRIEQQDKALQVANSLLAQVQKQLEELQNEMCYVWSPEHVAWWGVERNGYVHSTHKAGSYTWWEARSIIKEGNRYRAHDEFPYEAIVPEDCAPGMVKEQKAEV